MHLRESDGARSNGSMVTPPASRPGIEPDSDESDVGDKELETAGTETEEDIDDAKSIDFRDVVLAPSDWTVQTILSQLESGSFELDPDFQRRNAWTDSRRSKFIESLLLGLPIPQIVLAEKEFDDGSDRYIVIDGKQRLLALESFHSETDPLRLSQLTVLTELNGLTRQQILDNPVHRRIATRLDNRTIRTVVIRKWSDDSFLHLVFHRINHQTLALSAQELRQALHPGEFTNFADKHAGQSEELHRILGASQRPDFRMRDVELLVRHLAYRFRLGDYQGNLKKFLDEACEYFNGNWSRVSQDVKSAADQCDEAIQITEDIFGNHAFRRYSADSGWESRFNRAVFDIMSFYFVSPQIAAAAQEKKEEVVAAFIKLSQFDEKFSSALATTTKTVGATSYRLAKWGELLANTLDIEVTTPLFDANTRTFGYKVVSGR